MPTGRPPGYSIHVIAGRRVVRPLNTIALFVRGVTGHVDSQKYCNSPGELGWKTDIRSVNPCPPINWLMRDFPRSIWFNCRAISFPESSLVIEIHSERASNSSSRCVAVATKPLKIMCALLMTRAPVAKRVDQVRPAN